MADLDRADIVALLERLGADDDAAVLEAARALHSVVRNSGTAWDELLRRNFDTSEATRSDDEPVDESPPGDAGASNGLSAAETTDAGRLIERLMTRGSLSDTLRGDLGDLKRALADRSFDATDLRYVRALAKRLDV
jgi:hypothetical protein